MKRYAVIWLALAGCQDYGLNPKNDDIGGGPDSGDDTDTEDTSDIPDDVVTGGVRGTICDTPETGLANVHVSIEHEYGVATTVTDSDGLYELLGIPAGPHTLVLQGDTYFENVEVLIPENEVVEMQSDECVDECDIPVPCVGLDEAIDREIAEVRLTEGGITVNNSSEDISICMEDWVVLLSEGSQDAVLGENEPVEIGPGDQHIFPYGMDVYSEEAYYNEAWWCVERWQYTAAGSAYEYNGSLAPDTIFQWIQNRTDTDGDGIEDHEDPEEFAVHTQYNIWDTIAYNPIILVGRARSLVTLEGEGDAQVQVQVKNLGQLEGSAVVREIVPPGFVVSDVFPLADKWTLEDGSTELQWEVELAAAVPDHTYSTPTIYDQAELVYRIAAGEGACEGRCVGNPLVAEWSDASDAKWVSNSEPLIIEHCAEVDE